GAARTRGPPPPASVPRERESAPVTASLPVSTRAPQPAPASDVCDFEQLGVPADLAAALRHDGIDRPFPVQALTIPDALAGLDICGKAKTGSGKTLAFGLPLLARVGSAEPRRPTGLVLVPTRELANQVFSVLAPLARVSGREVVPVYGGVGFERQIRALTEGVDVVVGTPGRLIDLME